MSGGHSLVAKSTGFTLGWKSAFRPGHNKYVTAGSIPTMPVNMPMIKGATQKHRLKSGALLTFNHSFTASKICSTPNRQVKWGRTLHGAFTLFSF